MPSFSIVAPGGGYRHIPAVVPKAGVSARWPAPPVATVGDDTMQLGRVRRLLGRFRRCCPHATTDNGSRLRAESIGPGRHAGTMRSPNRARG